MLDGRDPPLPPGSLTPPEGEATMLARALSDLLPPGAGVGAMPIGSAPNVWPEEVILAGPARSREHAAGRAAARLALAAAGLPLTAIPMGADRAPVWPAGLAGSISHSRKHAVAAVHARLSALGIDAEPHQPVERSLWDTILTPCERQLLDPAAPGLAVLRIFCAKEAAYKAQYPLTRQIFGFEHLAVRLSNRGFTVFWQVDCGPFLKGDLMPGRQAVVAGHLLSVVAF